MIKFKEQILVSEIYRPVRYGHHIYIYYICMYDVSISLIIRSLLIY